MSQNFRSMTKFTAWIFSILFILHHPSEYLSQNRNFHNIKKKCEKSFCFVNHEKLWPYEVFRNHSTPKNIGVLIVICIYYIWFLNDFRLTTVQRSCADILVNAPRHLWSRSYLDSFPTLGHYSAHFSSRRNISEILSFYVFE